MIPTQHCHAATRGRIVSILRRMCMVAALSGLVSADSLQLAWNPNPEPDIAGYELRYGTQPGVYPNRIDAGKSTSTEVSGISAGVTYYFVVIARNRAGLLGPESNAISYRKNGPRVIDPEGKITSPAADLTIATGASVNFAASGKQPLSWRWSFGAGSGISDSKEKNPGARRFKKAGVYIVTLTVTDSKGIATPLSRTVIVNDPVHTAISREGWKLKYVDSQEAPGYAATAAFDGNPSTFWHTRFTDVELVREPHEIQIDLGRKRSLAGFQYLPRQDGFSVGNVGTYRFYVSADGKKWGKPVASGAFENSPASKRVPFKPKTGRYVRLVSLTEANGLTDSSVAELDLLELPGRGKRSAPTPSVKKSAAAATDFLTPAGPGTAASPPRTSTEVIAGEKFLALAVTRAVGENPRIEVSADLLHWSSGLKHTTTLIDEARLLKVRDNTPLLPGRKRFIRLQPAGR